MIVIDPLSPFSMSLTGLPVTKRHMEIIAMVSHKQICDNPRVPSGVTPGGARSKRRGGLRTQFSVVVASLSFGHHLKFFVIMNNSPDSLPNVSCFDLFVKNPKGCKLEVIQGSHKFLSDVINGSEQSPINSVFIGLFNQFTKVPIKDYVFQRMTKSILQELALCILQELISYGPTSLAVFFQLGNANTGLERHICISKCKFTFRCI